MPCCRALASGFAGDDLCIESESVNNAHKPPKYTQFTKYASGQAAPYPTGHPHLSPQATVLARSGESEFELAHPVQSTPPLLVRMWFWTSQASKQLGLLMLRCRQWSILYRVPIFDWILRRGLLRTLLCTPVNTWTFEYPPAPAWSVKASLMSEVPVLLPLCLAGHRYFFLGGGCTIDVWLHKGTPKCFLQSRVS